MVCLRVNRLTSLTFLFAIIITDLKRRHLPRKHIDTSTTRFVCLFIGSWNYFFQYSETLGACVNKDRSSLEGSMDEKTRSTPFSISNILSSHSSRDNEEREVTSTRESERDKVRIEVEDKGTVGGSTFTLHTDRKTPTHSDVYEWETESTGHSPEKSLTEFDRKYRTFFTLFSFN